MDDGRDRAENRRLHRDHQARHANRHAALFGRELAVFPPPVLDIEDTFFSRQVPVTPQTPGRRYLGVCAHGVRLKSAEIRLAEILLIAGPDALRQRTATPPTRT